MQDEVRTIDMTPTWQSAVQIYCAVLEDGSEDGKRGARQELLRIARIVDRLNEAAKKDDKLVSLIAEHGIMGGE